MVVQNCLWLARMESLQAKDWIVGRQTGQTGQNAWNGHITGVFWHWAHWCQFMSLFMSLWFTMAMYHRAVCHWLGGAVRVARSVDNSDFAHTALLRHCLARTGPDFHTLRWGPWKMKHHETSWKWLTLKCNGSHLRKLRHKIWFIVTQCHSFCRFYVC